MRRFARDSHQDWGTAAKVGLRMKSEKTQVMQSRCQTGMQLMVGQ